MNAEVRYCVRSGCNDFHTWKVVAHHHNSRLHYTWACSRALLVDKAYSSRMTEQQYNRPRHKTFRLVSDEEIHVLAYLAICEEDAASDL